MNDNKWRKGKTYTEIYGDDKAKITKEKQSKKAFERYKDKTKHPSFGKKRTDKTKKLLSFSKIGDKNPAKREEVRKKMSLNNNGRKRKGKTYEEIYGEVKSKFIKNKQSKNSHFRHFYKTHTVWSKGLSKETDKRIETMSLNLKGHIVTQKIKNKIRNGLIGNQNVTGKHWKVKDTSNLIKAAQKRWENPEYAKKVLNVESPNKEERHMQDILNSILPGKYKFVGNGKLKIGRKFPDFVNEKNDKLIELFGDFYHKGQNPQDRIDYFKNFGYDTLVIWASELYQKESITKNKIINFDKTYEFVQM